MNWDDMPANPVALEISAKFDRLMKAGGRIDRILNGHPDIKIARLSDAEADRILRGLEIQIVEYRDALGAAVVWMNEWKDRKPKGFRAKRRGL